MRKLVECIPNFSEGKDQAVLDALSDIVKQTAGCTLLDVQRDENHNRSVFTYVSTPETAVDVAFRLCRYAAEHIDLNRHQGAHPRMGATDVIPFVPALNTTIDDCIALSKDLAARVAQELHIPVFLYEESAARPERRNLAAIRKGEFEGMHEKIKDPQWAPDFGEARLHPTAGCVAIGARHPLVAFNVNLNTSNVQIAKEIAKTVRASSGGYQYCKALGIMLEDKQLAQVSMNMTNYMGTPLYRVFEAIKFEAARYGVTIHSSELVGLSPAKALLDSCAYYLQLDGFDAMKQVMEYHLIGE